jgi:phosphonate transport system permease protein
MTGPEQPQLSAIAGPNALEPQGDHPERDPALPMEIPVRPMGVAAPLWPLLPGLLVVPMLGLLPTQVHGGGWDAIGQFLLAALRPSLDPLVLRAALEGLGVTLAMALLGWVGSLVLGLPLGLASSRLLWRTLLGHAQPAEMLRRLLALPRSVHELLWGLLLLQVLGLQPAVAVLAISIPFGAMVARVLADQLDCLPTAGLDALRAAGVPAPMALLTALGPKLLPGLVSYGGYRLECALRSATLLGVFGLGGLGNELRLTLQSLAFQELWTGLWLLLAVMLLLETGLRGLRRRWHAPGRLVLTQAPVGRVGRELSALLAVLLPLALLAAHSLGVNQADWLRINPWPSGTWSWRAVQELPWLALVGSTLLLAGGAAGLAVGLPPLQLLMAGPWRLGLLVLRLSWALARLWPPPLMALLLLFVLRPGVLTGALAVGLHNLGILGRLLLEALEDTDPNREVALVVAGSGPRLAMLYGRYAPLARPYLAYGAYRSDVMLRETVVVGLVGATGLGSQLQESLSSFAWDQVVALVLVYGLLTLAGEEISDRLRSRLLRG